jgi:peptidoglycan-associated lipoprotein
MRLRIGTTFALLLTVAAVSIASALAQSQDQAPVAPAPSSVNSAKPLRAELALGYTYLRSNVPPGGCGCFNLNGGNATFAWLLPSASSVKPGSFALVGDVTITHAGAAASTGDSLTLSTFTAGARYLPRLGRSPVQPYGQALIGLAHSSGTLVQGTHPAAQNAGAAFAANLGGALDLRFSRRFSVRLIEADYLVTTFDNGINNHQNNLRITAGVVMRFGKR